MNMTQDYIIKLEVFEGPFDLLLSLIEKEQVDIYQVSLAKITSEYLDYIRAAAELNLDLAGDFLVMAAMLLKIKSKKLLPVAFPDNDDDDIKDESQLLDRLVEYKLYKQLAEQLQEKGSSFNKVYFRGNQDQRMEKQYFLKDVSLDDLSVLFARVWQTSTISDEIEALYVEEVSIDEKKEMILRRSGEKPEGYDFMEIFQGKITRFELVIGFLAILELVKQKKITLKQGEFLGPILICPSNYQKTNQEENKNGNDGHESAAGTIDGPGA